MNDHVEALGKFKVVRSSDLSLSWKRTRRGWGHSLHKLAPYVGSFPPSLAHYFILKYSEPGDTVLDPFSGSGTAPLQACIDGRKGIGNDVFSYAYTLTHAKLRPITLDRFGAYLRQVKAKIKISDDEPVDNELLTFYDKRTLRQLLALRKYLLNARSDAAIFLKAVICAILHGPSKMFLSVPMKDMASMTPRYVSRYASEHGLIRPRRDVFICALSKARRALRDPLPTITGEAHNEDVRTMPIRDSSADLIVTSPPYLGILDYVWSNWLRVWFLGKTREEERARLFKTNVIEKYVSFMTDALQKMYDVLDDNSACVVIVGDVRKNGRLINNARLLVDVGKSVGFRVHRVVDDVYPFTARSYVTFNEMRYGFIADENPQRLSVPIDRCVIFAKGRLKRGS